MGEFLFRASRTQAVAQTNSDASFAILIGDALRDMIAERVDQVDRHGFTPQHDGKTYDTPAELIAAAACYADTAHDQIDGSMAYDPHEAPAEWPWSPSDWRCRDARTNLLKASALIWAAIDLIDAPASSGRPTSPDAPTGEGDTSKVATGTEPLTRFQAITPTLFPAGQAHARSFLVRDREGNQAAAWWNGHHWSFFDDAPDREAVQLDFDPTHFLPGLQPRAGFIQVPVA